MELLFLVVALIIVEILPVHTHTLDEPRYGKTQPSDTHAVSANSSQLPLHQSASIFNKLIKPDVPEAHDPFLSYLHELVKLVDNKTAKVPGSVRTTLIPFRYLDDNVHLGQMQGLSPSESAYTHTNTIVDDRIHGETLNTHEKSKFSLDSMKHLTETNDNLLTLSKHVNSGEKVDRKVDSANQAERDIVIKPHSVHTDVSINGVNLSSHHVHNVNSNNEAASSDLFSLLGVEKTRVEAPELVVDDLQQGRIRNSVHNLHQHHNIPGHHRRVHEYRHIGHSSHNTKVNTRPLPNTSHTTPPSMEIHIVPQASNPSAFAPPILSEFVHNSHSKTRNRISGEMSSSTGIISKSVLIEHPALPIHHSNAPSHTPVERHKDNSITNDSVRSSFHSDNTRNNMDMHGNSNSTNIVKPQNETKKPTLPFWLSLLNMHDSGIIRGNDASVMYISSLMNNAQNTTNAAHTGDSTVAHPGNSTVTHPGASTTIGTAGIVKADRLPPGFSLLNSERNKRIKSKTVDHAGHSNTTVQKQRIEIRIPKAHRMTNRVVVNKVNLLQQDHSNVSYNLKHGNNHGGNFVPKTLERNINATPLHHKVSVTGTTRSTNWYPQLKKEIRPNLFIGSPTEVSREPIIRNTTDSSSGAGDRTILFPPVHKHHFDTSNVNRTVLFPPNVVTKHSESQHPSSNHRDLLFPPADKSESVPKDHRAAPSILHSKDQRAAPAIPHSKDQRAAPSIPHSTHINFHSSNHHKPHIKYNMHPQSRLTTNTQRNGQSHLLPRNEHTSTSGRTIHAGIKHRPHDNMNHSDQSKSRLQHSSRINGIHSTVHMAPHMKQGILLHGNTHINHVSEVYIHNRHPQSQTRQQPGTQTAHTSSTNPPESLFHMQDLAQLDIPSHTRERFTDFTSQTVSTTPKYTSMNVNYNPTTPLSIIVSTTTSSKLNPAEHIPIINIPSNTRSVSRDTPPTPAKHNIVSKSKSITHSALKHIPSRPEIQNILSKSNTNTDSVHRNTTPKSFQRSPLSNSKTGSLSTSMSRALFQRLKDRYFKEISKRLLLQRKHNNTTITPVTTTTTVPTKPTPNNTQTLVKSINKVKNVTNVKLSNINKTHLKMLWERYMKRKMQNNIGNGTQLIGQTTSAPQVSHTPAHLDTSVGISTLVPTTDSKPIVHQKHQQIIEVKRKLIHKINRKTPSFETTTLNTIDSSFGDSRVRLLHNKTYVKHALDWSNSNLTRVTKPPIGLNPPALDTTGAISSPALPTTGAISLPPGLNVSSMLQNVNLTKDGVQRLIKTMKIYQAMQTAKRPISENKKTVPMKQNTSALMNAFDDVKFKNKRHQTAKAVNLQTVKPSDNRRAKLYEPLEQRVSMSILGITHTSPQPSRVNKITNKRPQSITSKNIEFSGTDRQMTKAWQQPFITSNGVLPASSRFEKPVLSEMVETVIKRTQKSNQLNKNKETGNIMSSRDIKHSIGSFSGNKSRRPWVVTILPLPSQQPTIPPLVKTDSVIRYVTPIHADKVSYHISNTISVAESGMRTGSGQLIIGTGNSASVRSSRNSKHVLNAIADTNGGKLERKTQNKNHNYQKTIFRSNVRIPFGILPAADTHFEILKKPRDLNSKIRHSSSVAQGRPLPKQQLSSHSDGVNGNNAITHRINSFQGRNNKLKSPSINISGVNIAARTSITYLTTTVPNSVPVQQVVDINTVNTGTPVNTVNTGTPVNTVNTGTPVNTVNTGTPVNTVNTGTPVNIVNTGTPVKANNIVTKTPLSSGTSNLNKPNAGQLIINNENSGLQETRHGISSRDRQQPIPPQTVSTHFITKPPSLITSTNRIQITSLTNSNRKSTRLHSSTQSTVSPKTQTRKIAFTNHSTRSTIAPLQHITVGRDSNIQTTRELTDWHNTNHGQPNGGTNIHTNTNTRPTQADNLKKPKNTNIKTISSISTQSDNLLSNKNTNTNTRASVSTQSDNLLSNKNASIKTRSSVPTKSDNLVSNKNTNANTRSSVQTQSDNLVSNKNTNINTRSSVPIQSDNLVSNKITNINTRSSVPIQSDNLVSNKITNINTKSPVPAQSKKRPPYNQKSISLIRINAPNNTSRFIIIRHAQNGTDRRSSTQQVRKLLSQYYTRQRKDNIVLKRNAVKHIGNTLDAQGGIPFRNNDLHTNQIFNGIIGEQLESIEESMELVDNGWEANDGGFHTLKKRSVIYHIDDSSVGRTDTVLGKIKRYLKRNKTNAL